MWNLVSGIWVKVIKSGFFATWARLTAHIVKEHLIKRIETVKGNLRTDRKMLGPLNNILHVKLQLNHQLDNFIYM